MVRGPVRAGDADRERGGEDDRLRLRRLDDRVEHLLDLELAVRPQVRAAAPRAADDAPRLVGEERPGLRAPGVDPEHMPHGSDYS